MAVNHVILKEFHIDKKTPYFLNYVRRYTDAPFLVELEKGGKSYSAGRLLRAASLSHYSGEENGDWKFLVFDSISKEARMPGGAMGHRWGETQGKWNLEFKDAADGSEIDPMLSFIDDYDELVKVAIHEFASGRMFYREIPAKRIQTENGERLAATAYDLLLAQYGVSRGLAGDYPENYDDERYSYTPSWQERLSGVGRETVIKFAREWASTAEATEGRCSVIIGAGINHSYHNNLMYRAAINALMLCGCVGRNGGGLNHYVGQEKLALVAPWATIAFARDWVTAVRLQNAPSWHYVHSEQWRYEGDFTEYHTVPQNGDGNDTASIASGHTVDLQAKAVRLAAFLPAVRQA